MNLFCKWCNQLFLLRDKYHKLVCPQCSTPLDVNYDYANISSVLASRFSILGVWRYEKVLPAIGRRVSLREGNTPLYKADKLSDKHSCNLYIKYEGANPTGSFKDRGMTVATSFALQNKVKVLLCASTGNTSASLAAYAARAGLKAVVLIPAGKIALGKLTQALAYGANVVQIKGDFDKALSLAKELANKRREIYLMNSVNPIRLEGQKTIAFEIYEQLGKVPDVIVMPIGNAGNIRALWKGFRELVILGVTKKLPKIIGVQASGASPIVNTLNRKAKNLIAVKKPETIATAIRIGAPVNWRYAVKALRESKGFALSVSDREILQAQMLLSSTEGIFVEPASAAPTAALGKLYKEIRGKTAVCIATGNGLKDPDAVTESIKLRPSIKPDLHSLEKAISK